MTADTPGRSRQFPKGLRLLKAAEFARVGKAGKVVADSVLVVRGARNGLDVTRLGLAVSRQVGNAVVRNRWKRRIREAFRHERSDFPRGLDLVVRPRKGAALDYDAIRRSLRALTRRLDRRLGLAGQEKP